MTEPISAVMRAETIAPTPSVVGKARSAAPSQALKSNMLGDPSVRVVDVYVPAGHDGQGLPLLVDLVGFTGSGLSHTNWVGFRENLPERLDRLIGEERMPPVVVAFPDCFTRLPPALGKISCCMRCCRQSSTLRLWRERASRRLRQELWRVWRDHPCAAPLRHLGGCGLPSRRYVFRALLSARHASGPALARRRRELHRALVEKLEAAKKHSEGSGKVVNALAMPTAAIPIPRSFWGSACRSRSAPARFSRNAWRIGCGTTLSLRSKHRLTIFAG
jgi:hypothetical protein